MPRIQLESAHHFCSWLHNEILIDVPFGLSLRLRPWLTQPSAAGLGGVLVLVRPHVGYVLASLTAEVARVLKTPVTEDNERVVRLQQDGEAASCCSPERPNSPYSTYPFFLLTCLHLTSTNMPTSRNTDASLFLSAATCTAAAASSAVAVDGVGRKTFLFASMLSHCAEWWDADNVPLSASAPSHFRTFSPQWGTLRHRPFIFFTDTAAAAGHLADPSSLSERGLSDGGARRRLLRVLRLLSAHGGWKVCVPSSVGGDMSSATASASSMLPRHEEGESVCMDWLDYLAQRCVEVDLRPTGDYDAFENIVCCDVSPIRIGGYSMTSTVPRTESSAGREDCGAAGGSDIYLPFGVPDPCIPLSAVLWHILATEVEGVVLETLHRLLLHYIWWPFFRSSNKSTVSSDTEIICKAQVWRYISYALQTLAYTPKQVLACDLTHAARSGSGLSATATLPPPIPGPVTLSCLLPSSICLLPLTRDSECSRFFIQGIPVSTAPDGSVLRRHPLRALLLRVDPEGDWLPQCEALSCQRTFYVSFCAQMGETLDDAAGGDDDNSGSSEDSEVGKRTVLRDSIVAVGEKAPSPMPPSPPHRRDRSPTEDYVVSVLTARVLCSEPFAHVVHCTRDADRYLWRAAIRLFIYVLLHGVRVVITPERLPAFVKVFGYRHMAELHAKLCEIREELKRTPASDEQVALVEDALDAPTRMATVALLDDLYKRELPVAVYVVDQVFVSSFSELQSRSAASGATGTDRSVCTAFSSLALAPVVLCRDVLRHSSDFDDLRDLRAPSGICELAHCGVLDTAELRDVFPNIPSQRPPFCAEEVMMRFAASVASGDRAQSRMHDSRVLVAALHPLFTHVSTGAADVHRRDTDVGIWSARTGQPNLPERVLPFLLLVAPTQTQAVHYCGVLRKAALALREALPNSSAGGASLFTCDSAAAVSESPRGAVRGGGAFFVCLAREIQWLLQQLSSSPVYTPAAGPAVVSWGETFLSHQERAAVRFVLAIVSEACGEMVTRLAEPLIEESTAAKQALFPLQGAQSSPMTRGPRARRRLWMEALRTSVRTSSRVPSEPVLHAYHKSVDMVLWGVSHGTTAGDRVGMNSLYEEAMQWFASDKFLTSFPEPGTCGASERRRSGCVNTPSFPLYPLLEPLHTNVRAVREALTCVLLTLSATVS